MEHIVKRNEYDHPEHHKDKIAEYSSDGRYVPVPLGDLLLEQAGHRCTVCNAPYVDIHHINPIEKGGKTEYDNLIVLCPNCHRRVHKENIPDARQLKHYKLKLEVTSELPVIGHLSTDEKFFIKELSIIESNELVLFNRRYYYQAIQLQDDDEARKFARRSIGLLGLETNGIITSVFGLIVRLADSNGWSVELYVRVTPKGIKWIDYLKKSEKLSLLDT